MEWIRWQENPWGQEIILGLSWELVWIALALGGVFAVGHALVALVARARPAKSSAEAESQKGLLASLPATLLRHTFASRSFHWVMAISILTLLFTAFLPIMGLKFPWVTAHWIAGFVLTAAIGYHILHTTFWKGLRLMWIGLKDIRIGLGTLRKIINPKAPEPEKSGKNPVESKLFHHGVATAVLATVITGLIMMLKITTPWWKRNPYILPDETWGIIYLIHGAGSVALIAMVLIHFYFAARPDKWWITLSMIRGWIRKEDFLQRHDPELWKPITGNKSNPGNRKEG